MIFFLVLARMSKFIGKLWFSMWKFPNQFVKKFWFLLFWFRDYFRLWKIIELVIQISDRMDRILCQVSNNFERLKWLKISLDDFGCCDVRLCDSQFSNFLIFTLWKTCESFLMNENIFPLIISTEILVTRQLSIGVDAILRAVLVLTKKLFQVLNFDEKKNCDGKIFSVKEKVENFFEVTASRHRVSFIHVKIELRKSEEFY